MADSTDESGREEIWLRSLGNPRLQRQVSTQGGMLPYWVEDGREIEYIRTTGGLRQFWRVQVTTEPELETGSPRLDRSEEPGLRFVDTLPSGETLAIEADPREIGLENRLYVVLNWFESLEQLLSSGSDGS